MSWKKVGLLAKLMGKADAKVDVSQLPTQSDPIQMDLGGVQVTWDGGDWSISTSTTCVGVCVCVFGSMGGVCESVRGPGKALTPTRGRSGARDVRGRECGPTQGSSAVEGGERETQGADAVVGVPERTSARDGMHCGVGLFLFFPRLPGADFTVCFVMQLAARQLDADELERELDQALSKA